MTAALLACIGIELGLILLAFVVYAVHESKSADHYREEHLAFRSDELVYRDLLAEVVLRRDGGGLVVARRRTKQSSGDDETREKVSQGSHSSSFPGWDKP